MDKIDRLGWADGISFISYGVRVGIRVNRPAALDQLITHLPPGWKASPSPVVEKLYSLFVGGEGARPNIRRYNLLYADILRSARSLDLEQILDAFESDLHLYIAEAARRRVFVHAGVVGWKGKAIVIPGRSFSGKSTLVAEMVRAGAEYYSDEYAVFDSRGRVHPFPRPLSLRENGPDEKPIKYSAEEFGAKPGVKPLPVGVVLVSQYKPDARWRPRKLTKGQGALALLANTVSARRQPETVLATLRQVVSQAPLLKGVRGEAEEVVDTILRTW